LKPRVSRGFFYVRPAGHDRSLGCKSPAKLATARQAKCNRGRATNRGRKHGGVSRIGGRWLERFSSKLNLDNGQVWRTTQTDSALEFKANDKVVLSRRILGGYEISLAGHNASVSATRIR
jgi:hypothetical protein